MGGRRVGGGRGGELVREEEISGRERAGEDGGRGKGAEGEERGDISWRGSMMSFAVQSVAH